MKFNKMRDKPTKQNFQIYLFFLISSFLSLDFAYYSSQDKLFRVPQCKTI